MNTFLPYPDFKDSAWILDDRTLYAQRLEAKQIVMTLEGKVKLWQDEPAVLMWQGHPQCLSLYGFVVCTELLRRGFRDSVRSFFALRLPRNEFDPPWWLGWDELHRSHQSNLIKKMPERYGRIWPDVPDDLPLVWPTSQEEFADEPA